MCTTCGCGNTEELSIKMPGKLERFIKEMEIDTFPHSHFSPNNQSRHHDHDHEHQHTHRHRNNSSKNIIEIEQNILQNNQLLAERNRGYFQAKNIFALNFVSSPGSGKTTILETTLARLKDSENFYVIEGDQQTMNDTNRIDALNIPVIQINTGKACHLDSQMVNDALEKLQPKENSILIIENVGNLVCPAAFDLGENKRVVIVSTTEGDDKPLKYPDMFADSQVCMINKTDLLPYVNFDMDKVKDYAKRINPNLIFFEVSATTEKGMESWYNWLQKQL